MSHTSDSDITNLQKIGELTDKIVKLEALLEQREKEKSVLTNRIQKFEKGLANLQAGIFEWDITTQRLFLSLSSCADLVEYIDNTNPPPDYLKKLVSPEVYLVLQSKWLALVNGKSEAEYVTLELRTPGQDLMKMRVYAMLHRDEKYNPQKVSGFIMKHQPGQWTPDLMEDFEVFETLPVGIVCLDIRSGNLISANEKARQILQINDEFAFSDDDPFNKIDWSEITDELIEKDFIQRKEVEIRLADGSKKWILFSGKPSGGHALYATILDFTDIKNTINELQKVNFELDNFVYHASHDLRAPLRTVLGLLSLLKQETSKQERVRCVELIEGTINRLDTLVVDLLSISRNNRTQQRFMELNFMVEVNIAVSNFYHVGNTRNLEIITKVSQPVRYVSDLTRIRIILNNLISNAIKYRRHHLEHSFIEIRIWVDSENAHIEIEDNGEGIDQDKLGHIFEMFYRASERSEGSGLGLYIVKDVVEKLDGVIEVVSEKGAGTTFTVTLPNHYTPPVP